MQIVDIFRANIVNVGADELIVEVTGDEDKIESLCNLLRSFGIKELARPRSYDFNVYGSGASTIAFADGLYAIDPGDGGLPFKLPAR